MLIYNGANHPRSGAPGVPAIRLPARPGAARPRRPYGRDRPPVRAFLPIDPAEAAGQVGNVCFAEGLVAWNGEWRLYVGLAEFALGSRPRRCGSKRAGPKRLAAGLGVPCAVPMRLQCSSRPANGGARSGQLSPMVDRHGQHHRHAAAATKPVAAQRSQKIASRRKEAAAFQPFGVCAR